MRQLSLVLAVVCASAAVWACSPAPASAISGGEVQGDDDDDDTSSSAASSTPNSSATAAAAPLTPPAASTPAAESPSNASTPVVRAAPTPALPPVPPALPALPDPPAVPVAPPPTCDATCVSQHPEGVRLESTAGPAFLACICGSDSCADVCAPSSYCSGAAGPSAEDDACIQCLDDADSPDIDFCIEQDDELCPAGSDCDALRQCVDACVGP